MSWGLAGNDRRQNLAIVFGAGLFGLLPMATDVYLTAFVDMQHDFGVTQAAINRTMIAFTLGFALAHLVIGRISDQFGRRPVAIGGTLLFTLVSVFAAIAPTLDMLVAARVVQGACAACGPVIARALVRDTYPPERAGWALSAMGAAIGIVPLLAPAIGTAAAAFGGWRAAFWALAAYGGLILVALWLALPETRPEEDSGLPRRSMLAAFTELLRHPAFLRGGLAMAMGYGALFTWLSHSPFLMIGRFGYSRAETAGVFVLGSAAFMAGGLAATRLSHGWSGPRLMLTGAAILCTGAALTLTLVLVSTPHWTHLLAAMTPFYIGWGMAQPQAIAVAMRPFPHIAGQASAWLGAIQQLGGAAFSLIAALLGSGALAIAMMVLGTLGVAVLAVLNARADRD